MAKKETFKSGADNASLDFNFDDFDVGSIERSASAKSKNPRSPTTAAIKGAISGAKSMVFSTAFVDKAIRAALPKEYGQIADTSGTVSSELSRLYNDAVREIKPSSQRLIREIDKLVPKEFARSKKYLDKLKEFVGTEERSYSSSLENDNESQIQSQLASIFAVQAEQTQRQHAQDKSEQRIDSKLEAARFKTNFGLLSTINVNLARLATYNDKVNSSFQKKSLEIQYRSYFAQKELLETSKRFFEIFKIQQDDIKKNTGLPDYVKLHTSEMMKEIGKRKFIEKAGNLFSQTGAVRKGIENLRVYGKQKISSVGQSFANAASGLEAINMSREEMAAMNELAASMGEDPETIHSIIGSAVGSMSAEQLASMIGRRLNRSVPASAKKLLFRISKHTRNIPGSINKLRKSKALEWNANDAYGGGPIGAVKNKGKDILRELLGVFAGSGLDKTLTTSGGMKGLTNLAIFDQRTQKSITTIIPGYLSRIYRELQILRSGNDKIQLTEFDHRNEKFATSSKLTADTKKVLISALNKSNLSSHVNINYRKIVGNAKLSKDAESALQEKIHDATFREDGVDAEYLLSAEFTKGLKPEVAREIQSAIALNYNKQSADYYEKDASISHSMADARDSIADIRGDIQTLMNAGYERHLMKIGIVKRGSEGSMKVDMEAYKKLSKSGTLGKVLSQAVSSSRSSSVSSGSGGRAFQSVVSSGRTSSLNVSSPGSSSSGTSGTLAGSLTSVLNSEATAHLQGIKSDTAKIVEQLNNLGKATFGSRGLDTEGIKDYISRMSQSAKNGAHGFGDFVSQSGPKSTVGHIGNIAQSAGVLLFKTLSTVTNASLGLGKKLKQGFETTAGAAGKVVGTAGKAVINNKDAILNTTKAIYESGMNLVGTVFERAKTGVMDLITNQLPAGMKSIAGLVAFGKDKLKSLINGPVDVYVRGRRSPALTAVLMRAGMYRDQATGKILETLDDIKGPVINLQGEIVLSLDDIKLGLIDSYGKPIVSLGKKLLGAGLGLAGEVFGRAGNALKALVAAGGTITERLSGAARGLLGGGWGGGSREQTQLLTQIRDLLNTRLPGKRTRFGKLGAKPTTVDTRNEDDSKTKGQREGGWQGMLGRMRERNEERKKQKAAQADPAMRYKGGNVIDGMLGAAGSAYDTIKDGLGTLGDLVGEGRGRAPGKGGILRRGAGALGRGAAALGRGAMAAGGMLLGGSGAAGTAATVARTGLMAGSLLTGGIASAVAGTAGLIASAIASPVVLGIGAAALAGYGIYKGFKYFTRNNASNATKVRLAQYGLGDSQSNNYNKIFQLEEYLQKEGVGISNRTASLLEKKIDQKEILGIFDISENEPEALQAFISWFQNRFKPVFLTHLTSLYNTDSKLMLADIDKLDAEKMDKYLKAASNTPEVYKYTVSPFKNGGALDAGSKEVTAAMKAAEDEYRDKLPGNKKQGIISKAFSFMTSNDQINKLAEAGGIKGALGKILKYVPGLAFMANVTTSYVKFLASASKKIKAFFSGKLTALESVRFKTYGLSDLTSAKVSALKSLEEEMTPFVKVNSNNVAEFTGDVLLILRNVGGDFGISSPTDDHAVKWISWFKTRFLPAFLNFAGSGFGLVGTANAAEIEPRLKPNQKYDVAVRVSGTEGVWNVSDSPWPDNEKMCSSTSDCTENLQFLKEKAKSQKVEEEKVGKPSDVKNSKVEPEKPQVPPKLKQEAEKVLQSYVETEDKKLGATSNSESTTVSGGSNPIASGTLADPSAGDQYIKKQHNKVNIDGLNPEVLKNFRMMAAEYGSLTGKSITVNSAVRSYEHQLALYKADPKVAAPPGGTLHELGLALDINTKDAEELDKLGLMRKYGFTRPVGGETWHIEPTGIGTDIAGVKKDPKLATKLVMESLGRGGGGYGADPSSPLGKRNPTLASSIWNDTGGSVVSNSVKDKTTSIAKLEPALQPAGATGFSSPTTTNVASVSNSFGMTSPPKFSAESAGSSVNQSSISGASSANTAYSTKEAPGMETESKTLGKSSNSSLSGNNPLNGSGGDVKSIIADAAKKTGVDPNTLSTFAAIESNFNPNAKASTSSASGLFQFIDSTWNSMISKFGPKYGLDKGTSPFDPMASSLMGGEFIKANIAAIQSVAPKPSATDLYLAHFLGAGGAKKFLSSDKSAIAAQVMPDAAKANKNIFYSKDGQARTIGEVYSLLEAKVQKAASAHGVPFTPSSTLASNTSRPRTTAGTPPGGGAGVPSGITSGPSGPIAVNESRPRVSPSGPVLNENYGPPPRTTSGDSLGLGSSPTISDSGYQTPRSGGFTGPQPSLPGITASNQIRIPESGRPMSGAGNANVMVNIDSTLTQSLGVQTEMLNTLRQLVSSGGLGASANSATPAAGNPAATIAKTGGNMASLATTAINLSRGV